MLLLPILLYKLVCIFVTHVTHVKRQFHESSHLPTTIGAFCFVTDTRLLGFLVFALCNFRFEANMAHVSNNDIYSIHFLI